MTYGKAMRRIVLPQAARVIIPPLGNEFNNMLKTTSLLVIISVPELYVVFSQKQGNFFAPFEFFLAAAVWYLLLTTIWGVIQAWIERRLGRGARAARSRRACGRARLFGLATADADQRQRGPLMVEIAPTTSSRRSAACPTPPSDVVVEATDVQKWFGTARTSSRASR